AMGGGMIGMFLDFPEALIGAYVVQILVIICFSNVIVGQLAVGGDRTIAYPFIAILFVITGMLFLAIPPVVDMFFSMEGLVSTGAGVV
ncbi:MAG: flagellar assembly protein FlaJ, partial [Methanocalculus sp.]|nr:flagellar assembly protein FlaJ [Methanocalculus sp.]